MFERVGMYARLYMKYTIPRQLTVKRHFLRWAFCRGMTTGGTGREGGHVTDTAYGCKSEADQLVRHQVAGRSMEGTLPLLLLLHASRGDTTSVHTILKTAGDAGMIPSQGTVESVLCVYISEGNTEAAHTLYHTLPQPPANPCLTLALCTLLIQHCRSQEALEILKQYFTAPIKKVTGKIKEECKSLLSAAAASGDYNTTKATFDILLTQGIIEPENLMVVPLLQCKLNGGSLEEVVEVAEFIFKNYSLLPKRMEILILLIKDMKTSHRECRLPLAGQNQGTLVGRMFELIVALHGPQQALHDLFFTLLEADEPAAAREVFQLLGKDLNIDLYHKMCKLYAKNVREVPLQGLLLATHGSEAVNRGVIYGLLLEVYMRENNGKAAVGLWTRMQKEQVAPTQGFKTKLTALLTASDLTLPL